METKIIGLLKENGLENYLSIFEKNKLDNLEILSDLTEADFEKLGISVMGDRKRLVKLFSASATQSPVEYVEPSSALMSPKAQAIKLIKCPSCGKSVSSVAKACPQCGAPIAEINITAKNKHNIFGILPATGAMFALFFFYMPFSYDVNAFQAMSIGDNVSFVLILIFFESLFLGVVPIIFYLARNNYTFQNKTMLILYGSYFLSFIILLKSYDFKYNHEFYMGVIGISMGIIFSFIFAILAVVMKKLIADYKKKSEPTIPSMRLFSNLLLIMPVIAIGIIVMSIITANTHHRFSQSLFIFLYVFMLLYSIFVTIGGVKNNRKIIKIMGITGIFFFLLGLIGMIVSIKNSTYYEYAEGLEKAIILMSIISFFYVIPFIIASIVSAIRIKKRIKRLESGA